MWINEHRLARRTLLKMTGIGVGGLVFGTHEAAAPAAEPVALSPEHARAVNRRRRIVVQYDPQDLFGIDFDTWLDYRFRYIDEPGTQIDSVWWDLGRLGQVLYPSKFLDRLENAGLQQVA